MYRYVRQGILPTLGLVALACGPPEPAACRLTAADSTAIQNLASRYAQHVRANDWGQVASLYGERSIRMPPGNPTTEGRGDIRMAIEAALGEVKDYTNTPNEISGCDGFAFVRGTYSMTLAEPDADAIDVGKYLAIVRKQPDGAWLIERAIWNFDRP